MSVIGRGKVFTRFYLYLRHAFQNAVVVLKTAFGDLAVLYRFAKRTARIGIVFTVAIFATA
jgi:hypothetical protein